MSAQTGVVIDIQRFSLHDGPGIRTTVFLKGCPLSCRWCHNPEAIQHRPQLSFNRDRCTDCFRCVEACSAGAHLVVDGRHAVDFSRCTLVGGCVDACPSEALSIIGRSMTVEEVLAVLVRDREYYARSGGGVTISGGEPMTQFEFTRALLHACKAEGLHTALETCGHVPTERYLEVLPSLDLVLFDYKETDSERHRACTGAGNALILRNLGMLHQAGAAIILRCPIVPGLNDTDGHLRGIGDLHRRYPRLAGLEIMPYHAMGVEKARRIGAGAGQFDMPDAGRELGAAWVERLRGLGCTAATVG